jgi:putative hydrolase of the HAD superfamily
MFKALFFDLGSTLIYFDTSWEAVLNQANFALGQQLHQSGVNLDVNQLAADFNWRMQKYYAQRSSDFQETTSEYVLTEMLRSYGLPEVKPEWVRQGLDAFYKQFQEHWQVEADALSTLGRLRAVGYKLALVTNAGDAKDVQTLIDKCGLRPYFDRIWISANVGVRKPHPRIFELALDSMHCNAKEGLMIGDTLNADILGAINIGMASIWITRRADMLENNEYRRSIVPDETIATLDELPLLLANW